MIKHVLLAILLIWFLFVRLLAEAVFDQLSLPFDVQEGGGRGMAPSSIYTTNPSTSNLSGRSPELYLILIIHSP